MELYGASRFLSPFARSAFVASQEPGLPFEMTPLDLSRGENQAADYAKQSLTQRVPTLVDGDFARSESSAIDGYLHQADAGPPLWGRLPHPSAGPVWVAPAGLFQAAGPA